MSKSTDVEQNSFMSIKKIEGQDFLPPLVKILEFTEMLEKCSLGMNEPKW